MAHIFLINPHEIAAIVLDASLAFGRRPSRQEIFYQMQTETARFTIRISPLTHGISYFVFQFVKCQFELNKQQCTIWGSISNRAGRHFFPLCIAFASSSSCSCEMMCSQIERSSRQTATAATSEHIRIRIPSSHRREK